MPEIKKEKSFLDRIKDSVTGFFDDEEEEKITLKASPTPASPVPSSPTTKTTVESTVKTTSPGVYSSPYDAKAEQAFRRADKLAEDADKALAGYDKTFFLSRQKEAEDVFKQAEEHLQNREVIEKLAHAISQLGAGLYGLKTGTDMSNLKFDKTDWDKKYDRALERLKVAIQSAKEQDGINREEAQFKANTALRKSGDARQTGASYLSAASSEKSTKATIDKLTQQEEKAESKATKAAADLRKKNWENLMDEVNRGKFDANVKMSELRAKARDFGVPADKLDDITDTWGFTTESDVKDAAAQLNELISKGLVPSTVGAPPPPGGKTKIRWKSTGKVFEVTPEQLQQFNKNDYDVI